MRIRNEEQKGFTLIELMITVAIIGVLAAMALPSYNESVISGKRADAKVELLKIAQMQESYFAQNLSYAQNLSGAGGLGFGSNAVDSEGGNYSLTMTTTAGCDGTAATPCTAFTLTATPQGGQVNDTRCLGLTLTNTGLRGRDAAGTDTVLNCWK